MARKTNDPQLVQDIAAFIGRYVVVSDAQRLVVATYVVHTHIAHLCQQTPYIFIHSPEPECGKSRLMEVMELLVARPWSIVNPSDAVLFRKVNQDMPTLLWDEIDAVFNPSSAKYHEEQRGMLDQGHRRHGTVPRFIGDKVVDFKVFCPKTFAGLGTLPDTLARRSIPISLKRRTADEPVEEFIYVDVQKEGEALRDRITAWAESHGESAASARPGDVPEALSDRMKEGSFSLMAIADLLGFGADLRAALVEILTGDRLDSAETMRVRLLRDIRVAFADYYTRTGVVRRGVATDDLLMRLHAMEESPWGNYYGRQLDAKDIADLLRPYGIKPHQMKVRKGGIDKNVRGYRREGRDGEPGLADAWVRYLGGDEVSGSVGSGR